MIAFLRRAVAFYVRHGITVQQLLTDNGPAYRSAVHAIACRALGVRHLRTRPYRPQTNGKAVSWRGVVVRLGDEAPRTCWSDSGKRHAGMVFGRVGPIGPTLPGVLFLACVRFVDWRAAGGPAKLT